MAYIAKRGKSWMVRVYFNDATGKRRSKAKAGFRTKAEARAYGIDVESKLKEGTSSIDSTVPFPDYFENWYKTFKKSSISARTQHSYEYTLKILKEYFGAITLKKMNRTLYQNFLNKFGGNHSKQTVAKINTHVRAAVKNATYEKAIPRDFTEQTKIVYDKNLTQKIEYLSIAEMKQLIEYISSSFNPHFTSKYMIFLAVYTGMRLGELQGLEWRDINFNFKTISIRRAWSEFENDFKDTKNESSKRIIRVNSDALIPLSELKLAIKPKNDKQQVFLNQYGTVPTSSAVNKTLRESFKAIGITKKGFHFHSLRHTHVAYLLANQIDLYAISKRLGHKDIGTTSKVYSYLIDEYKAKTDNQIDNALSDIKSKVRAHSAHIAK